MDNNELCRIVQKWIELRVQEEEIEEKRKKLELTIIENKKALPEIKSKFLGKTDIFPAVMNNVRHEIEPQIEDALPEETLALFGEKVWKWDMQKAKLFFGSNPEAKRFFHTNKKPYVRKVKLKEDTEVVEDLLDEL